MNTVEYNETVLTINALGAAHEALKKTQPDLAARLLEHRKRMIKALADIKPEQREDIAISNDDVGELIVTVEVMHDVITANGDREQLEKKFVEREEHLRGFISRILSKRK